MPKCRICDHDNPTGSDRCQHCSAWLEQAIPGTPEGGESPVGAGQAAPQPSDLQQQIISLLKQNQTIAAIKLYRERTGAGLAEAKGAVEALATGQAIEPGKAQSIDERSFEGQILALMRSQKKIEAIKLYRQQTGAGLKQAKDAVESLAASHGIKSVGPGCAGVVLIVMAALVLVSASAWVWIS
jgi:large subunit ribosomal protein L7/L12